MQVVTREVSVKVPPFGKQAEDRQSQPAENLEGESLFLVLDFVDLIERETVNVNHEDDTPFLDGQNRAQSGGRAVDRVITNAAGRCQPASWHTQTLAGPNESRIHRASLLEQDPSDTETKGSHFQWETGTGN